MKFVNLNSSKALDSFVRKHASSLMRRVDSSNGRYRLSMAVRPISRSQDQTVKSFEVTGVFSIRGSKDLRANKKHADVKSAVVAVVEALEKQIRRTTEKKERSRKTLGTSLKTMREVKWEFLKDC